MSLWTSLCSKRFCAKRKASQYPWLRESSIPVIEELIQTKSLSKKSVSLISSLQFKPILNLPKSDRIAYIPLIESSAFTLCAFYLPQSSTLPFHDHPNQHVVLKVLKGIARISACDTHAESYLYGSEYPITHSCQTDLSAASSDVYLVEPKKNNIHQITALTDDCLFLDFVVPPYSNGEHRITYFLKKDNVLTALRESQVDLRMDLVDIDTLIDS